MRLDWPLAVLAALCKDHILGSAILTGQPLAALAQPRGFGALAGVVASADPESAVPGDLFPGQQSVNRTKPPGTGKATSVSQTRAVDPKRQDRVRRYDLPHGERHQFLDRGTFVLALR